MASPTPSSKNSTSAQDSSPIPSSLAALHPVHPIIFDELYRLIPHKCSLLSRYHNARLLRTIFERVKITRSFVQWLLAAPHLERAGDTTTPKGRCILRKELVLSQIHTLVITSWRLLPVWDLLMPRFQGLVDRHDLIEESLAAALFPNLERFEWDMGVFAEEIGEVEVGEEDHVNEGWDVFFSGTAAEGVVEYVIREHEGVDEIPSPAIANAVMRYAIAMPFCSALHITFPDSATAASLSELLRSPNPHKETFLENTKFSGWEMPVVFRMRLVSWITSLMSLLAAEDSERPDGGELDKGWREMQKFCKFEELKE
ncbi:hypothetical protein IAT38_001360 [Cryptococcus sp. DSM 104549]